MKKHYLIALLLLVLFSPAFRAQTTETFETETNASASFTDNGQVFNITSPGTNPFDIDAAYPGTGWNGTAADNRYVDNDGTATTGLNVTFTISSAGAAPFKINSMYIFLSNAASLNQSVPGSLTIVGKLGGVTKFTATASSGFVTSLGTNNGFTFINMATYGGSNNTNTAIDQLVFTTGGQFEYLALDAFNWTTIPALSATTSQTNIACNGGSNGRASVSVSGGTAPYTYAWAPSGGSGATATSLTAGNYTCTITDASSSVLTKTFNITQPSALVTSTAVTTVACNGGSNGVASITASGGAGGYTYLWSNGATTSAITGQLAGVYTATVTDANSCTSIKSANITQPSALVTSTAVTNVACNGGSNGVASITASGGAGGYTYLWSNGATTSAITGQLAGVYTATVTDANSCTSSKSANITQPSALVTSTAVTNVACNGGTGSATITASGGAGGYTYLWSNGVTTNAITGQLAGVYTATVTDANSCTSSKSANITQPSALVTSTAVTNVACNGGTGSATITASGGAGGYTYLWSNGATTSAITGQLAGVYTATVTDANSCKAIKNASITQPSALVTSTAVTNVACNGGSNGVASITASGGAGGYTYLWSNGGTTSAITGLLAGVYTATVTDANSCTSIKNANITQPSALVTSTAVTNVACNGGTGSATITASGGTTSYSYLWSNGATTSSITGLLAGVYTATVTDANSCTSSKNANITQPSALVTSTAVTNVACNGGTGSATITASGGAGGYTYLWSNGATTNAITGQLAGVYTATVTDANSCTSSKSANITQPSALTVNAVSQTNIACFGGNTGAAAVSASGGTTSYSYNWTPGNPTGDGTASVTGLAAGNWTCTITDANSCAASKTFTITQPTAALTVNAVSQTNIACFGGNTGAATVSASGGTTSYTYDWTPGTPTGDGTASVTGLTAGNWTCTVTDANSCAASKTFTITQPTAALTVNAVSQTNIACFGGSNGAASVSASGGTTSYTYDWTPGTPTGDGTASVTGLAAGNWTCTVTDANSCAASKTFTITQPTAALTVNAVSQTNISCFGSSTGAAAVSVSGGTTSYSYNWTPGNPTGDGTASVTGLAAGNWTCTVTDANSCSAAKVFTVTQPATGLTASLASQTNVGCFGGSTGAATVNASGGATPYTYTWSPTGGNASTASGLSQGTYTCAVTDNNGCSATATVSISQPATLTATGSQTNITCVQPTGSAMVSVSGGTSPYAYSWTPSGGTAATATGLAAGGYTCAVTDNNGCSATQTFTFVTPATISATTTQTNVGCSGGSNGAISISVTGGTLPFTYLWAPGGASTSTLAALSAGNYTYTVTDANSCSVTSVISITQPSSILATTSQTNVSCNGGSNGAIDISVSGGTSPYNYTWTPSGGSGPAATGLAAGSYTCTITDNNGCSTAPAFVLSEPSALLVVKTATNISCNGGANGTASMTVSGGTAPYSYAWTSGGSGPSETNLAAGGYTCIVTDNNGCILTKRFLLTEPLALATVASQTNVTCNGSANGIADVSVSGGTAPYSYTWTPGSSSVSTATGLAPGDYTCSITDNNGCPTTQTLSITEPAVLAATPSQTNVTCTGGGSDGAASVNVSGGTAPYAYAWSPASGAGPGLTGLSAGTYTCDITDNNSCMVTQTFTLVTPAPISYTQSLSICQGQSLTVGTSTYSAAGTYTDILTAANACDSTVTTMLSINTLPTLSTTASNTVICEGSSVTLTSVGATTYTWTNGVSNGAAFTPTSTATYTVNATDANGCTAQDMITVTVNTSPTVTASATSSMVCSGQQTTLNAGGASTYTWTGGVSNGVAFTPATSATYTVTGTASNNCTGIATVSITVSTCTGIDAQAGNGFARIYPNPFSTSTVIRIDEQLASHASLFIDLYDNTGKLVKHMPLEGQQTELKRGELATGLYFYNILEGRNMVSKGKLIIQ